MLAKLIFLDKFYQLQRVDLLLLSFMCVYDTQNMPSKRHCSFILEILSLFVFSFFHEILYVLIVDFKFRMIAHSMTNTYGDSQGILRIIAEHI